MPPTRTAAAQCFVAVLLLFGAGCSPGSPEKEGMEPDHVVSETCRTPDAFHNPGGYEGSLASWTKEIAKSAGFVMLGSTGAAWYFCGQGYEFMLWATRTSPEFAPEGSFLAEEEGVFIFGGDFRLSWQADSGIVWIGRGPFEDSELPDLDAVVRPLVRASLRISLGS